MRKPARAPPTTTRWRWRLRTSSTTWRSTRCTCTPSSTARPKRNSSGSIAHWPCSQASTQADAKQWEGSLRNNRGYALHQLGRNEEALAEFKRSLAARERQGNVRGIRIAHWMIAMTLRHMGRLYAAMEIQLRLEREWDADHDPDPYVFEELEKIYRARGDPARADHYAARLKATQKP